MAIKQYGFHMEMPKHSGSAEMAACKQEMLRMMADVLESIGVLGYGVDESLPLKNVAYIWVNVEHSNIIKE